MKINPEWMDPNSTLKSTLKKKHCGKGVISPDLLLKKCLVLSHLGPSGALVMLTRKGLFVAQCKQLKTPHAVDLLLMLTLTVSSPMKMVMMI